MFYRKHSRVTLDCGDVVITKQSHKSECDITTILKQYQRTGIITHVSAARPTYEDLPDNYDYQQSLNLIIQAQDTFAALPAKVRADFNNDPAQFLAAFNDPAKEDYLREYGFLKPKEGPQAPSATPTARPPEEAPGGPS